MTRKEFDRFIQELKLYALNQIVKTAPYKTGALSREIYIRLNNDGFSIVSPISYMKFTEEPWDSNFANGRLNPNTYWLKNQTENIVNYIKSRLK